MKTKFFFLLSLVFFIKLFSQSTTPFIITWTGTSDFTIYTHPNALASEYNYNIKWYIKGQTGVAIKNNIKGNYTISGTSPSNICTVEITGNFPGFNFDKQGWTPASLTNASYVQSIDQWGNQKWKYLDGAFSNCKNLKYKATDTPDFSIATSFVRMFLNCSELDGNISMNNWNTTSITNMSEMFFGASKFNSNIVNWNTSSVTHMNNMFTNASLFNQPIGNWDTSSVKDMSYMFHGAESFNQPLDQWNTHSVQNMRGMFGNTNNFNQAIGNWDVSSVTIFSSMFENAKAFNQSLGNWNMTSANDISYMFSNAIQFNQPLENWSTSSIFNIEGVFKNAAAFNQNIGNWSLKSVNSDLLHTLNYSGLNCQNYDATLIGWANNPDTPYGKTLGARERIYSSNNAVIARNILSNVKELGGKAWSILYDKYDSSCNNLSTMEILKSNAIIYPNPTNDFIIIKNIDKIKSKTIYDSTGQLVKKENNQNEKIDISNLQKGVYLLEIETKNNQKVTKKIVKK